MCQTNPQQQQFETALLAMGISVISKAMEAALSGSNLAKGSVLEAAVGAYQQGKITKSQFIAVINALDEQTYQTRAYAVPTDGHLAEYWR